MTSEKISLWIQVLTSIAVIVGLCLVVLELRQSRTLTNAQISQETMTEISSEMTTIFGEHAARTLSRACFTPNELTDEDLFVLHHYFRNQAVRISNLKVQVVNGGFETPWRIIGTVWMQNILQFPQGKSWVNAFRHSDPIIDEYMREQAQTQSVQSCKDTINAIRPT